MERSRAGGRRGWVRADGGIQLMYMCVCPRSVHG